ncbi:MAG TPA: hypothetical protein VN608_09445 [Clostridia bacterium]|nr:hypothetical protein [Clostridia bacterium]
MAKISKRFSVALDIKRAVSNRAFEVVEGDNGNIIDITLTDDGEAVDLTGCRVLAVFSKSNGISTQDSGLENGGVSIAGNVASIALSISSIAPGMVECELRVYSGEHLTTLVTSAKFNFGCRKGIFDDNTAADAGEFPLLMSLIAQCSKLIEEFDGLATHASRHAADGADPIRIGETGDKAVYTNADGTLMAGTLPIASGGTGANDTMDALVSLGAASAEFVSKLKANVDILNVYTYKNNGGAL